METALQSYQPPSYAAGPLIPPSGGSAANPAPSLRAATDLTRQGISVIPIPYGQKAPTIPGWPNARLAESDLGKYFGTQPTNMGVLLGISGLTDIDKDCEEARYIAHMFLPETGLEFGRESAPYSHSIYWSDPPLATESFDDPIIAKQNALLPDQHRNKASIIEIRGTKSDGKIGMTTVVPPSTHPSGEEIEHSPGTTRIPANIDGEILRSAARKIAAAVLLSRYFPAVGGGRNQAFLSINGALVRAGWSDQDVYQFSLAIRCILYRDQTKENHCRLELDHTFQEFKAGKPLVGIRRLKEFVDERAVSTAFDWLGITGDSAIVAPFQTPQIDTSNRPLHEITADAIRALHLANQSPHLFVRGQEICRLSKDENGSAIIEHCTDAAMRGEMDRCASYVKTSAKGESKIVGPPLEIVKDLMARPINELGLPRIKSIVYAPCILPDGRLLATPGYDPQSGIFYSERFGLKLPECLPIHPSREDAIYAREFIENEILVDFPFEDEASRANALAAIVTAIVRPAIEGPVPMHLTDATAAGSGKGLYINTVATIIMGHAPTLNSLPKTDEETRKLLTSIFMRNPGEIIVFDNITNRLDSGELAKALTANVWGDRILGHSRDAQVPVRCTWFGNGNNVAVGGDMARRCIYSRLDPKCIDPFLRRPLGGYRHPELARWAAQHRGELLAHVLTMCRAWYVAGCPKSSNVVSLGSFEDWSEIVGGILEYAGVYDFMGNASTFYRSSDSEAAEWEDFLTAIARFYAGPDPLCSRPFTAADLVRAVTSNTPLSQSVPSAITPFLAKSEGAAVSVGRVLGSKRDTRFGQRNIRLVRSANTSPVKYVVQADRPFDGES